MSPEQLKGQPADDRSDIFALGTVLYAMATGIHPFHADSSAETISSILGHEPPAGRTLNPEPQPGDSGGSSPVASRRTPRSAIKSALELRQARPVDELPCRLHGDQTDRNDHGQATRTGRSQEDRPERARRSRIWRPAWRSPFSPSPW